MSKIIFVSGPSGMSKTKIKEKLEHLSPVLGFKYERVIITTSRDKRPEESQGNPWYFDSAENIEKAHKLNPLKYLKEEIRPGEPQGLDTQKEIVNKLSNAGILWCELHINWLNQIEDWVINNLSDVKIIKIFFAPLSEIELNSRAKESNCSPEQIIETEMTNRLIARRSAGLDNMSDEKLKGRAIDAINEYSNRNKYDCIIVNHQGEESLDWGQPKEFPTGEAAIVFNQFLEIYRKS